MGGGEEKKSEGRQAFWPVLTTSLSQEVQISKKNQEKWRGKEGGEAEGMVWLFDWERGVVEALSLVLKYDNFASFIWILSQI